MSKEKLFLLDGMALAYRAHFAFIKSNLMNSEGISTGPIFGFARTIEQLLAEEQPTHIAVAWDTHAPTFRHEMDDQYKANRPPQPDELKVGIPLIKEMMDYYHINNIEQDGFEADDIIGTIAKKAGADGVETYLVTPDKDFMQLVTQHVKMYKPLNSSKGFDIIDIDGVIDYFGVGPDKVIDVLALIGDTSDNIPGVSGIGKKGAPKLIKEYDTIENLVDHAEEVSAKRAREGLLEGKEQALKSKEMVTIVTEVPNTISWEKLNWEKPDQIKLYEFYKRMQFRSLTKTYAPVEEGQTDLFTESREPSITTLKDVETDYRLVDSSEKLDELVSELSSKKVFCFDTETTGTDPMRAEIVGISFSWKKGTGWYIPTLKGQDLELKEIKEKLKDIFNDEDKTAVAHNLKYDYLVLKNLGLTFRNKMFDTMLAAYLIDPNQKVSMDKLAEEILQYKPVPISALIGKGKKQKTMDEIDVSEVAPYACEDADITWQLYEIYKKELKDHDLEHVAYDIEFPLSKVLAEMEYRGVYIDKEFLNSLSAELDAELKEITQKIYEIAGEEFNINSTKQLGEILFEKLDLPVKKKTSTGKPSTAENVLVQLADEKYEIAELLLTYRTLSKLNNTYVAALPKLIQPETGRVHTSFNQHIAATGRLSSSNPNLQNIPIRTERGREVRKAFSAPEGTVILAADYSQIELRVIASIAEDEAMKQAFKDGEDIHSRTAKEVFELESLNEVDGNMRRKAKEVNFGIPYGVSKYGLASRLDISNDEAGDMIENYLTRFQGVDAFMKSIVEEARKDGFVKTLTGRRRFIPDINSRNFNRKSFAERTAINTPIQGTAADIIKIAMLNLEEKLKNHPEWKMLLQVHDELVFEIPESDVDEAKELISDVMQNAMDIGVPLDVEAGIGQNWLEAH
jgi:DNA polymerase-1